MEPKFKVGQSVVFTQTHKPYYIGEVIDILKIDDEWHYATKQDDYEDGYFPERYLALHGYLNN